MRDILTDIVADKRREVARRKEILPAKKLYAEAERLMTAQTTVRSMRAKLAEDSCGIIAEFKRKSPSKGWIHPDALPTEVVPLYEANGAAAVSILTDEKYFGGSAEYITELRPRISVPILRKDFIIDEYQIFEAKAIGADAILLIAADLTKEECRMFAHTAHELRIEVLLEIHAEREIDYIDDNTDMIGVNNRNLGTFHTDVENSFRLAGLLPKDKLKISESGISNPDTIRQLRAAGFGGFLIGECFMREDDPGDALRQFIARI